MSSPREFIDAYINAYEALDVEAFVALYSDDARVFDSAEPVEYPSKESWRTQVEGWFGSLSDGECDFDDLEIIEAEGLAVINGHVEYEGTLAGTDEEVEIECRATFVLQRFDDQWLVVHEHTSIPVEMDDEDDWFPGSVDNEDYDGEPDADDDDEQDEEGPTEGKLLGDQDSLDVEGEGHRGGLLGEGGSGDDGRPTEALNQ